MQNKIVRVRSAIVTEQASTLLTVESTLSEGIGIHILGLADKKICEVILRVATAMGSRGYKIPGKKMVVNIVPALPNEETDVSHLDLPIAVSLLALVKDIAISDDLIFAGELGLDGEVRETPAARTLLQDFALGKFPGKRLVFPLSSPGVPKGVIPIKMLDDIEKIINQEY